MFTRLLDRLSQRVIASDAVDFTRPAGEPAVVPPDSVSWRVFRNPVTMYVGGVAAVLLELGEPRVRHGVWDHSSFRQDPARRLRRTGMAAMVTVYGAQSEFEALARRVNRMHARIGGTTPDGRAYAADDPELLLWVQVTASWAFLEAYARYAAPLPLADRDRFYAEGQAAAALYGVERPPRSEAEVRGIFAAASPRLEPSSTLEELIHILRTAPILPAAMRPIQRLVVAAAVDLLPPAIVDRLGLAVHARLGIGARALLRGMARLAERVELPSSAHAQALRRLGMRAAQPASRSHLPHWTRRPERL